MLTQRGIHTVVDKKKAYTVADIEKDTHTVADIPKETHSSSYTEGQKQMLKRKDTHIC